MKRYLVFCCVLALGCSDTPAGVVAAPRYQLILVDDQPLPKLLYTFGLVGAQHLISEGELRMDGAVAFQRNQYMQKNTGSDPFVSFTDTATSSLRRSGSLVIIVHKYGLTEVTDTGYVDGSLLIVRQNLKDHMGQRMLRYFNLKYQEQ